MLAYIFWHQPHPNIGREAYEAAIVRFQQAMSQHPSPGMISNASFRIEPVPWLGDQAGYEDWCLLQGSWAMDPLNSFAVTGERQPSHDDVAAQMGGGHGGLYAHIWGEFGAAALSTMVWLTRPRGIQLQPVLEAVRRSVPEGRFWRRQMVLGPALEFGVEIPDGATLPVPDGWTARQVHRTRLTP